MSEVKRYVASYTPYEGLDLNGACARYDGDEFVMASDFDAERLRADTAVADVAALREELFQCNGEYDRAALKSAAFDEDGERALYEAFYIERAKTVPLPLGNSPLRYAGGQYINDFALFGWMVWLSRAQSRVGSSGQ